MVNSDSTKSEKYYLISETAIRQINANDTLLDSLTKRFQQMSINSKATLNKAKQIGSQIFAICEEENKTAGIIITNNNKIRKNMKLTIIWRKIREPLLGLSLFYLGYKTGVNNWITLKI